MWKFTGFCFSFVNLFVMERVSYRVSYRGRKTFFQTRFSVIPDILIRGSRSRALNNGKIIFSPRNCISFGQNVWESFRSKCIDTFVCLYFRILLKYYYESSILPVFRISVSFPYRQRHIKKDLNSLRIVHFGWKWSRTKKFQTNPQPPPANLPLDAVLIRRKEI